MGVLEVLRSLKLLVSVHALTGEIGALAFLWVLVELVNRKERGYIRARYVSLGGFIFSLISWITAGAYYTLTYGKVIKPVILEGELPWVHNVIMETKEHVFIFIPILALTVFLILLSFPDWSKANGIPRRAIFAICILIVILGFAMAGMGYIISATVRFTIGGGI